MGECFFWYRPTRVVPDQRPLNGRCRCCCSLCFIILFLLILSVCVSVCVCVWAMLPDSKKMMMMIGNSSSEQTYFLPHVLLVFSELVVLSVYYATESLVDPVCCVDDIEHCV